MSYFDLSNDSGPFRFLFYITNQTYDELCNAKLRIELTLQFKSFFIFAYFVTNDGNFVTLSTLEMFKTSCGESSIEILNLFDKNSSKWEKKLKFEDKFMDFNGCELVMILPVPVNGLIFNFGYAIVNHDRTDFKIFGLIPEIFRIAADKFNFVAAYQPVEIIDGFFMIRPELDGAIKFCEINGKVKTATVMFAVFDITSIKHQHIQIQQTFLSVKAELYSTPAEQFSSQEKFLMIFDRITWILLDVVTVCMILTALIAHQLSLTDLNSNSFRFILFFICLIFGTFFQNKSFEFMAAEPRRPPPKTVQDLIDGNYSILESNAIFYEEMIDSKL